MIFPITLLLLSPFVAVAVMTIDRLIRAEHKSSRAASESARSPGPAKPRWLDFYRVAFVWLFRAPTWVQQDPEAQRLLRRLRICAAVWNVGVLIAFAVQMTLTGMRP
jgi:hypothetical protein